MREGRLVVERRVPVLAAGHEDAVHIGQDSFCGVCVGDLGQVDRIRAVPLKCFGKALIVAADGVLLPRNADGGAAADLGDGHRRDCTVAVNDEVCGDRLAKGTLAGVRAEHQCRLVRFAHNILQFLHRVDAIEGLVLDDGLAGDSGLIDHIVFQLIVRVDGVQNR